MASDEGPDNLVLRYLRELDRKIDNLTMTVNDLKTRVTAVEGVLGLLVTQVATLNNRLDHVDTRLDRIERRLDLVQADA